MRRYRHQINIPIVYVDWDFPHCLRTIGVKVDLFGAAQFADFFHGLNDADLVIDGHYAHQHRIRSNGSFELFKVDQPITLHRQVRDLEAFVLQMSAAIQHALVFCLTCDDVFLLSRTAKESGDTFDAHIIALCCATGEDDFFRVCSNELGDVSSGLIGSLLGFPAVCMGSGVRVAVHAGQVWQHGVEHSGVDRGRGLSVKIDRPGPLIHDGSLLQNARGRAHHEIARHTRC